MSSINVAILLGNVGRDPDINAMPSGDRVATLRMATSETWKDKQTGEKRERTEWHTVTCFNQGLVGVIEKFVRKGTRISVQGEIRTRKWQAQDGSDRWSTEIVIPNFGGRLGLEPGGNRQNARQPDDYGETRAKPDTGTTGSGETASAAAGNDLDDDIPF